MTDPKDAQMTDTLVERLRAVDVSWSETGEWCAEAADRIIALEAELKTVRDREADTHRRHDAKVDALEAEIEKLKSIVQGWHYLAVGPDEMGDYYTQKQLIKASEPYASPALATLEARNG